ncbi:MAG TPA: peroxidase, partial [Candidatus Scalindua sp.]|nr:peroxidase [Candidatus Scalindua sp.]
MARISVVGKEEASKDVQEILAEIEDVFGKVPNLFKTYSHFPPLLKANWDKVKALMMRGNLSRKT